MQASPTPTPPQTPAELLVSLIVDDFRKTVEQSELGRIVKWTLKTAAPIAARWALELLVIRFAPLVAPVIDMILPWLEKMLVPSAMGNVKMLAAVVKMSPSDFHPAVRKSMASTLARSALQPPELWRQNAGTFPELP